MPEHRPDEPRENKRSSFPDAGDNFRALTLDEIAERAAGFPGLLAELREKGWG